MLPPRARRALRIPLGRRRRVEMETDDEIRFHLAMRVDALVAGGMPRDVAEAEAVRRFGLLDEVRPQLLAAARHREERLSMFERFEALRDDVRYAIRQLRRAPAFSAALALTFALGIGANATMFEILDRLLFRPPAFMPDADRVGRIYIHRPRPDGTDRIDNNISYLRYTELRDHTRAFATTAAVFQDDQRVVGTGAGAEALAIGLVSSAFWKLFDVRPELGRFFAAEEDVAPNGTDVVVVSHGYWVTRLGSDPAVLGKTLRLGSKQYTIIGVTPEGFNGIWATTTVAYIPITSGAIDMFGNDDWSRAHNASWLEMIARLRPGITPEAATAELTSAFRRSRTDAVAAQPKATPIRPQDLALSRSEFAPLPMDRGPRRSDSAKVAAWLAGVAAIVLLIACANVANLLIARGIRRRREIAVRVALGVGRGRLVAQLLTESVLIAVLGGILGLLLAHFGGGAIRALLLPNVDWSLVPAFDVRVLLFTGAAAVLTGLLTGLAPAVHALRADVNRALKAGEREGGGQRAGVRNVLLLAQAALSVVLLIGAALFVRSLRNVEKLDLGWDPDRVLLVGIDTRGTNVDSVQRGALTQRVLDRLRATPGVTSASTLFSIPFQTTWTEDVFVAGMDSSARQRTYVANPVGDDYFATMGTRILRGRAVGASDPANGPKVVVISEAMGKLLWKGKDPMGQCLRVGADTSPCREVVGIAEDMHFGDLKNDDSMQLYMPSTQERTGGSIVVRVTGDPRLQAEPMRRQIQQLLPGMGYARVRPIATVLDSVTRQWRLGATMFTIFGFIALLLAAVGLYGVIAYDIAQRMREMGVRVALGAQAADIRRLVLWQGIRVAAGGAALGVIVAAVASKYIAELLFNTSEHDPLAFIGAAVTILVVSVLATLIPARRATRVDPVVALRSE
ncbi:MAG TPA: ABC transporter permease [Gemmatimonadaceae bacterium]|nr:ABC transporter permease [Gemmatimonadaceae bacterium]